MGRCPLVCLSRLLLFSLLLPAVCAFAQAAQQPNLTATWKSKEGITLKLAADGTGLLDQSKIKYAIRGRTLSIDDAGTVNNYTFELRGNALTLSGGDLKTPMVFEREGATGGLGARRQQSGAEPPTASDAPAAALPARTATGPAGTWEVSTPSGPMRMVLNDDGTGNINGEAGTWKLANGVLTLAGGQTALTFNAVVTATTMTLSNASLPQPLVFTRVPAPGAEAAPASPSAAASPQAGNGLIGDWQGPSGVVSFKADGTVMMQGQPGRYAVQGNTLTLIGRDGTIPLRYQVSGDVLTLASAAGSTTLKRVGAGAAGTAGATGAPGGGRVLPELVGKWCLMSNVSGTSGYGGTSRDECFTLSPDGRYQYHSESSTTAYSNVSPTLGVQPGVTGMSSSQSSDEGTWTATATTITANSRTRGVTTYQLVKKNHPKNTNDPMICLDGTCFVTYYQKPPWR